jgi:hypothetical protein
MGTVAAGIHIIPILKSDRFQNCGVATRALGIVMIEDAG